MVKTRRLKTETFKSLHRYYQFKMEKEKTIDIGRLLIFCTAPSLILYKRAILSLFVLGLAQPRKKTSFDAIFFHGTAAVWRHLNCDFLANFLAFQTFQKWQIFAAFHPVAAI